MSANAQVDFPTGADTQASKLCASFEAPYGTSGFAMRYCSRVTKVSGEAPGYAFVAMPCKDFPADESSSILALKNDAIGNQILPNTRAEISYAESNGVTTRLLVGTLVSYCHNLKEDSIIAEIVDDRWMFSKITVFGRSVYDPSSKVSYFDATSDLCFNRMGYPDCIDTKFGPMFAPSYRFGWQSGGTNETTEEPAPGYAYDTARKWRVEDVLLYFRNQHSSNAIRPLSPVDYGVQTLPNSIQWTKEIAHFVGSNRVVNDVNCTNMSLLGALQDIVRRAGAYDINVEPAGPFRSALSFVNMNPLTGQTGTALYLAGYEGSATIAQKMQGADWIFDGNVRESIINRFPHTCIVGDPVSCERMVITKTGDDTFGIGGLPTAEKAWNEITDAGAKNYIDTWFEPGSDKAEQQAMLHYPDWLCAFRTGKGVDLFKGTKWEGTPLGARYARIHPSQLTAYSTGGSTNPAQWQTREIVVEMKLSQEEIDAQNARADADGAPHPSEWKIASRYDNLNLNPDSTILYLENLRHVTDFSCFYTNNTTTPPTKYVPRDIRIQIAVQSTWAITGSDKTDYNHCATRINPQGPKWTYLTVSKPGDYVEYLRAAASRPDGDVIEQPFKTTVYPTKATAGNELYSDRPGDINNPSATGRLPSHAACRQADVNRIDYSGQVIIARLAPAMKPGLPITIVGDNLIKVYAIVKSATFVSEPGTMQHTVVEFGPPDSREIYDSPGQYKTQSGGGSYTYSPSNEVPVTYGTNVSVEIPQQTPQETPYGYAPSNAGAGAQGNAGAQGDKFAADPDTKEGRKAATARENREGLKRDKAEQRRDKGSMTGGTGFRGFGAGSSGSMTHGGKTTKAGDLFKDRGFGTPGSGRMTPGGKGATHREWETETTSGKGKDNPDAFGKFKGHTWDSRFKAAPKPFGPPSPPAAPPAAPPTPPAPSTPSGIKKPGQSYEDYQKDHPINRSNW